MGLYSSRYVENESGVYMSFLYHGSCQSGLKKLETYSSTHGNLVYAIIIEN